MAELQQWAVRCLRARARVALRLVLARLVRSAGEKGGTGKWLCAQLFQILVLTTVADMAAEARKRRPARWWWRLRRLVLPGVWASLVMQVGAPWQNLLQLLAGREAQLGAT